MAKPGPQKINRYGVDFKLRAVQMSQQPGVLVKDVAESLCIHPFMLSLWRRQVRDGELTGDPPPIDVAAVGELRRLREVEQQYKQLQMEHDLLKKSYPVCLRSKGEVFAFIQANRETWPLTLMCKYLGVSAGGFYAWQARRPSQRDLDDAALSQRIRDIHVASRGIYGSPRVMHSLRQQGHAVGQRRVARLMRGACLQGRSARLYRRSRVSQRAFYKSIPNRQRHVEPARVDQVWVGDVTYLKVNGQWRYLAVVMDKYSRRILGWSLSTQRDATLTTAALELALRKRSPQPGLFLHTDRGIEYAALNYRAALARHGVIQSMNRPGRMNDNAHMESFFHSLKTEYLYGKRFDTDAQLRQTLLSYLQFYNHSRLHSSLDHASPAAFEQLQTYQSCVN